jgi:hypothetical protein
MELKIERNRYSPAEVALLGIFAFGLLLAVLLVANRKRIPFSDPVIAPFDGISISMPLGRGWKGHDKWQFSSVDNAFVLQSILKQSSMGIAQISWKYCIASEDKEFDQTMKELSSERGFKTVRAGTIKIGELDFSKMIFSSPSKEYPDGIEDYYYASCKLPFGRELKLQVRTAGDAALAERVFETAIKKIKYTEDPRLAAGNSFVEKLKLTGADALLKRETAGTLKRFYLIKRKDDASVLNTNLQVNGYTGFGVEVFSSADDQASGGASASTLYFLGGIDGWTGSSLFNCDRSMDKFLWQTKQRSLDNRRRTGIELEYADGVLRCYDLQTMIETIKNERVFYPSPLAVSELFLDSLAAVFLDQANGDILIDLILPDGRIVPAEISILDSTENLSTIKADYAVRITLYNSPANYYNVLFDRDRNIVGKTENDRENYELKRTGVENIIEVFNDRKADIEKMLKNT